jgi:hypothetical protein
MFFKLNIFFLALAEASHLESPYIGAFLNFLGGEPHRPPSGLQILPSAYGNTIFHCQKISFFFSQAFSSLFLNIHE